jgi:glycosyltransferase involved in cell wall biosynthesis
VRRILYVIPDLDHGAAATQLRLLAGALPPDRFTARVCVLGPAGPEGEALGRAGVPVEALGWRRLLDVRPFLALRRLVREFQPDVLHAWQPAGLRAAVLARGVRGTRVIASAVVPARPQGEVARQLDRWLMGEVERLHCRGPAEAERYRRAGLPEAKFTLIPPGVRAPSKAPEPTAEAFGLPAAGRVVLCVGPLEPHKGFRDAIWAFDILKYLYDDLYLVIAGEGSDRRRLEEFARRTGAIDRVRFLGRRDDLPELLARSDVVWVPSRSSGGVNVALEAMAAGRPVVASGLPELAEVVRDGEAGFLVPPGDKVALARQTRRLLDDAALRARAGEAGRRHVAQQFSVARLVQGFTRLYDDGVTR